MIHYLSHFTNKETGSWRYKYALSLINGRHDIGIELQNPCLSMAIVIEKYKQKKSALHIAVLKFLEFYETSFHLVSKYKMVLFDFIH